MKKLFFLGLGLLMAAGITGCKDDVLSVNGEDPKHEVLDSDQTFYIPINLMSVGTNTRADGDDNNYNYDPSTSTHPDYDKGTALENKVSSIYLVFYDEAGDRVAATGDIKSSLDGNVDDAGYVDPSKPYPSHHIIYSGVVEVEAKHGQMRPSQVVAIVNPITPKDVGLSDEFATLDALEQAKRQYVVTQDTEDPVFPMSKSAYYGDKKVTENGQEVTRKIRLIATPIKTGMLFNNKEDAQAALDSATPIVDDDNAPAPLDIYVERYAAKVQFSFEDGDNIIKNNKKTILWYNPATMADAVEEGEDVQGPSCSIRFVPKYWAVNAYENETYITKSFYEDRGDGGVDFSKPASYDYMNTAIGGDNGWKYWNNETDHRCYWSQSPAYYANRYPRVSDDILDNRPVGDNKSMAGYALNYYSYNDLEKISEDKHLSSKAREYSKSIAGNYYASPAIYVRENTVSGAALQTAFNNPKASPKAAIGSIILAGKYELTGVDGKTIINLEGKDSKGRDNAFYIMGTGETDYKLFASNDEIYNYYFSKIGVILSSSPEELKSIFEPKNVANGPSVMEPINGYDYFTIKHPDKEVRRSGADNEYLLDSRFVTLQFDEEKMFAENANPLYMWQNGSWVLITEEDIANFNWNLMSATGIVRQFTHGMAYFNIPINHLGYYRKGNTNYWPEAGKEVKTANDRDFNWSVVKSGDFGIVRNHSYHIQATAIEGLGNAIPDPTVPIVPPTEPDAYYLGARVVVLNWALVPTQKVVL